MARKPRIHLPGRFYHVMLRGNAGQDIFFTDEDRYHLYLLIQEGVERFGHRVHAFCCMSNHIHLAIQVADLNPLRAGIVEDVANYRSSLLCRTDSLFFSGSFHLGKGSGLTRTGLLASLPRMRKICSMVLMSALLMVSSIPLLPMGGNAQAASYRALCHMSHIKMVPMNQMRHVMTPAMRHLRIECCGHHDVGGLPHLLAPHTVSLTGFAGGLSIMDRADANIPALVPRLSSSPVPPPRIS